MIKKELRTLIRERKRQYSEQQLRVLSLPVIERLKRHPRLQQAQVVMLYYSLSDEVDTHTLLEDLRQQGKTLLLPKVTGESTMELRRYDGPQDLREGSFHIMEPIGKIYADYDKIELAIIPGMSFDADGNRLGRGKGYYDRFLPLIPHAYKIGLCFDFQKTENVPHTPTDIAMDEVI